MLIKKFRAELENNFETKFKHDAFLYDGLFLQKCF